MALPTIHKVSITNSEFYYIKTSDVYESVKTVVGIEKVADPTGTEEVMPVKELLRTGVLWRIGIRYKDSGGKRKSATLLVTRPKLSDIFGADAGKKLEDKEYKIGTTVKGKIEQVSGRRRASYY